MWCYLRRETTAPLKGRAFKIQENEVDGDCAEKASSAALRGLKAQQVPSTGQRPGFHVPNPYALLGRVFKIP